MSVWGTVASDGETRTYVAASATGQVVIAASSATPNLGIGISHDWGVTWTYSNISRAYSGVAVTSNGLTFFASYAGTLVKSTNGTTWSTFYTGIPQPTSVITRDGVHVCGGEFYTGDSGSTTNLIQSSLNYYGTGNVPNKFLSVSNGTSYTPVNPNTLVGYSPQGMANTTYGSFSLSAGVYTSGAISSSGTKAYYTWSPANSNIGVILVNTAYGTSSTWTTPSPSGLNWGAVNRGFVACSTDGSKVLLIADAVYISTDSGTTFVKQTDAPAMTWGTISDDGTVVHGVNGTSLVMMVPTAIGNSSNRSTTNFVSNTAQPVWAAFGDGHFHSQVAASASGRIIIAGANQTTSNLGIAVSRDFGASWAYYASPYTTNIAVASLAVSSDGSTFVAGTGTTSSATILISTDGGATWTARSGGTDWPTVMCKTPSVITTNNSQSVDGGATFTSRISSEGQILAASADGANLLATFVSASITPVNASTGKGSCLSVSHNHGATWTNVSTILLPTDQYTFGNGVMSADGTTLAAVFTPIGTGGTGALIALSTDSGVSWIGHSLGSGGYLSGLNCSSDGSKFVATYTKLISGAWSTLIYTSADGGTSWYALTGYPGPQGATNAVNTISDDGLCMMQATGGTQLTEYLSHPFFATTGTSTTSLIGFSISLGIGTAASASTASGIGTSTAISTATCPPGSSTDGVGFRYITVWSTGTAVSTSTANFIGWIQRFGTFTLTPAGASSIIGGSYSATTGTAAGTSSSAVVGARFVIQPFTAISSSATAFVGTSFAVASFNTTSTSTTSVVGKASVAATFAAISASTSFVVGNWLMQGTGVAISTSSTNMIGAEFFISPFTAVSTSTTSGIGRSIVNQPFSAVSASTTGFIGGARTTGTFTSLSASTSAVIGLITRSGTFTVSGPSSTNFVSAWLLNAVSSLPRPTSGTQARYTPKPITALAKAVLATLKVTATATYTPQPITATVGQVLSAATWHAVAGFVPAPISSQIAATLRLPRFTGVSTLVSALNCFVWGVQIENEAGITSYIPTHGSAVDRAADHLDITTSDSPYMVTMNALILCSLAQAILNYTPQTSNEATDILNQYITLFDNTIAPASNLGWIPTVSALTKLRTAVLQYLQQQISVEPTVQLQNFGDQVPDAVAAYAIFGDATRAHELVASNDPVNPLYMPTRVSYNNS